VSASERCRFRRSQRVVFGAIVSESVVARIATHQAQRRWRLNYPRGGDEYFADHYRGRRVFSPLLPDTMNNLRNPSFRSATKKQVMGTRSSRRTSPQVRRGEVFVILRLGLWEEHVAEEPDRTLNRLQAH
jgi:hypothetical protein